MACFASLSVASRWASPMASPSAYTTSTSVMPIRPSMPLRWGVWLSMGVPAYWPPRAARITARLPSMSPWGPFSVYWKVLPERITRSNQALSWEGTPRL